MVALRQSGIGGLALMVMMWCELHPLQQHIYMNSGQTSPQDLFCPPISFFRSTGSKTLAVLLDLARDILKQLPHTVLSLQ